VTDSFQKISVTSLGADALHSNASEPYRGTCLDSGLFYKSLEDAGRAFPCAHDATVRNECVDLEHNQKLPLERQQLPDQQRVAEEISELIGIRAFANAMSITADCIIGKYEVRSQAQLPGAQNIPGLYFLDSISRSVGNETFRLPPNATYSNVDPFIAITNQAMFRASESQLVTGDAFKSISVPGVASVSSSAPTESLAAITTQQQPDSKATGNVFQQPPPSSNISNNKPVDIFSSHELTTHLRVLKSEGGGEARLQLHPAELGRMVVSLVKEGEDVRLSFVVENNQARQALESSLPRLRDLLDQAGFSLTDADIEKRSEEEQNSKHDQSTDLRTDQADLAESDTVEVIIRPFGHHSIDTFA